MGVNLRVVEGPPGAPPDVTKNVATLAWCPALAVALPNTEVAQIDSPDPVREALGHSLGSEVVARRTRITQARSLLMSHLPSVPGSISAVAQSGLGPPLSVAATSTHPHDDASVIVRVTKAGAPGVAEFELSHGFNVISQGNVQRLYGAAQVMAPRLAATIIGTVDLTTIVYAKQATVIGTADVSDPTLYGAGGSLAGKTIEIDFDGALSPTVYTIPSGALAPANLDALIAELNSQFGGVGTAAYTSFPYLAISGIDVGITGAAIIVGGTALALLGYQSAMQGYALGNVDLVAFNYNAGAALDGLTVIISKDGGSAQTCTFSNAVTNSTELLAELTAAINGVEFSLDGSNFLLAASATYGLASTIALGAGTAHTAIFGTPTIVAGVGSAAYGTAGALDGKTVLLDEDTTTEQTITFGTGTSAPTNAQDVLDEFNALTNVTSMLYSSRNFLSVSSGTIGSVSTLAITSGTALALLGLVASVSPATGAESSFDIEHLGVRGTWANGSYKVGTTYAFDTAAPMPSVAEVETRLRELDSLGQDFGVVHIAAAFQVDDALALGNALHALGLEWEGRAGSPRKAHFVVGVDINEDDAVVKATFAAFRSRFVDFAARGAYLSAGIIPGGARLLRSQSWPAADADALIEFHQDRGEAGLQKLIQGFPEVNALTEDENLATVKLVNPTGMRFNVMIADTPARFQFEGGYSSADASSSFTDASVRNVVDRGFVVFYAALARQRNRTDLDTNPDGTLTPAAADLVITSALPDVRNALVPLGATQIQIFVDTTNNFYQTREIRGSCVIQNRVPGRKLVFTIGPGLITESAT